MIKKTILIGLLTLCVFLVGCEDDGIDNEFLYIFSDGTTEFIGDTHYMMAGKDSNFQTEIAGTDLTVRYEKIEEGEDNGYWALNFYDENKQPIYNLPANPESYYISYDSEKLYIWLADWNQTSFSLPTNAYYMNDGLSSGELYIVDSLTGELISEHKTGEDELFLTAKDGKSYYYHRGYLEEQGALWWKKPANATVYYREDESFNKAHLLHSFEFDGSYHKTTLKPSEVLGVGVWNYEGGFSNEEVISFEVLEDSIDVSLEMLLVGEESHRVKIWTTSIPFDLSSETSFAEHETAIKFKPSEGERYIADNISIAIDDRLMYYPETDVFISEGDSLGVYRINVVKEFAPIENEPADSIYRTSSMIFGQILNINHDGISSQKRYNNDSNYGLYLKELQTDSGEVIKYNLVPKTNTEYELSEGVHAYVFFESQSDFVYIEIESYYDPSVANVEEIYGILDEMVHSMLD